MKNKLNTPKIFNFGFAFLKVFLSFDVIRTHLFKSWSTKNKFLLYILKNRRFHVPCFFILSFYFSQKEIILLNYKKFKNRLERLLIPYIFWPIIIFLYNNIFQNLFNKKKLIISLKDLIYQILYGHIFIRQLWFQWDLIMITIFFYIFIFIFKKKYLFFLQLLYFLAYIFQYSGNNRKFFYYLKAENRVCISRLAEMLPYAVIGFTLSYLNIIKKLQNYKIKTLVFCLIIYNFISKYLVFSKFKFSVAYGGIKLNIISICIIFIFSLFPSEKITNMRLIIILKFITNYTAGVFYLHNTIIFYFKNIINPIKRGSFKGCIIVYLICYFISFIGIKIFGKTKLRNLFS